MSERKISRRRRLFDRRENLIGCWGFIFVTIEPEEQPFADGRLCGLSVLLAQ